MPLARVPFLLLPLAAVIALLVVWHPSFNFSGGAQGGGRIRAATSISVFADFIRQVGQDRVEVVQVVPNGADVHTFDPTPADVRSLQAVNVVFLNGRGLDESVDHLARQGSAPILNLSDGIQAVADPTTVQVGTRTGEAEDRSAGNPHLWMNPANAARYVERVRAGLAQVDPSNAGYYAANAAAYITRLKTLDAEIAGLLAEIPADRRQMVTFHDAFPAFAQHYNLDILGVVIGDPEQREPSAADLAALSLTLRGNHVRTVFTEPQFSGRALQLVAQDLGIKTAELYADTFTVDMHSYEEMLRADARAIASGLR